MSKRKEYSDFFNIVYYGLFIPSYIYFTYRASLLLYECFMLGLINLNRIIIFITAMYYPLVLFLYLHWAFKYKTNVLNKGIISGLLWIVGWGLFPVVAYLILIANL